VTARRPASRRLPRLGRITLVVAVIVAVWVVAGLTRAEAAARQYFGAHAGMPVTNVETKLHLGLPPF